MSSKLKLILLTSCAAVLIVVLVVTLSMCGKSDDGAGDGEHFCAYSDWTTVTEPTCEENGLKVRECSCGEKISEEIDALGHSFAYGEGTFVIDTAVPIYRYACNRTGCDKTESMEANKTVSAKDPTCEDEGYTKETYYVFVNGEYKEYVKETKIDATGHSFNVTSGTWTWNGYNSASYTLTCTKNRSHAVTYTATIADKTEPATCTANGRVIHTATVDVEGETASDVKYEAIYKTNHSYDYDNGEWVWYDRTSASYIVTCANDPSHTEIKTATSRSTVVSVPDCDSNGCTTHTVSVYMNGKTYTDTKEEIIFSFGHDYDTDTATWEWMDNGNVATVSFTCKNGTPHTVVYEAEVEYTVTSQPTCFDFGYAHAKATFVLDGKTFTDERNFDVDPCDHELDWPNGYWEWDGYIGATLIVPCKLGEPHNFEAYADAIKVVELPDCSNDGYESYVVSVEIYGLEPCDDKRVTLPATGHDFEIINVTWMEAGRVSAKIDLICKNDSRHEDSDVGFSVDEILVAPTCTTTGTVRHTVTIEVGGKEFSASKNGVAPKNGHLFSGSACYHCEVPIYTEGLDYTLTEDESGYILTGIGSFKGDVLSIPDTYEGLPVVEIASNAFYENTTLKAIYISENITKIGSYAFYGCNKVEKVIFTPTDGTLDIGDYSFSRCASLEMLDIPGHVTRVKTGAFSMCTSLVSARIAAKTIYTSVFSGCKSLGNVELLDGVVSVDNFLSDVVPVFSLTIPSTVTAFNNDILMNARLLEIKNLSKYKVETIYTFKNIYTATEGGSCLWIDSETGYIFYKKGDIRYLMGHSGEGDPTVLPETCNGESYTIYQYALSTVDFGYTPLNIPDGVVVIHNYAVYANTTLKVLCGGRNVENIGNYAFYDCTELLSVTLGPKLKSLPQYAFYNCRRVCDLINHSSLNVQGSVKLFPNVIYEVKDAYITDPAIFYVDDFAFYSRDDYCYLVSYFGKGDDGVLGQLTLPTSFLGSTYGVYKRAIRDIDGITKIKLGGGVNQICSEAFFSDFDEIITDGSNLKIIESEAFKWTKITYIYLPSTLEYIGEYAFPETLERAKFGSVNDWKIETIGLVSVDPEDIMDEEKAAKYLYNHKNTYFKKVTEE